MVIDKIGNLNKVVGSDGVQKKNISRSSKGGDVDSVSISREAVKAQEMAKVQETVRSSEDIRADRVQEVKSKLARGDYDNIGSEIIDKVADKIAQSLIRG